MNVQTDHQIVAFGDDKMVLFNSTDGQVLVTAERPAVGQPWTISATGATDATAADRPAAVTAMCDQALSILPGTGYSTMVPSTLVDLP